MEPKNHRHKPQASASMRPSISSSEHMLATSDLSIKHLTAPGLHGILQDHNTINFKLIKTGSFEFYEHILRCALWPATLKVYRGKEFYATVKFEKLLLLNLIEISKR
ncbi:hypothetical protein CEXT_86941 [Caerostris extrusa]|uniref:Uncharacterized protein n=1 Tax=Caerostris extrusa TaxID=172846 RepID=A0AAV4SKK9_CAEEX|nr:hypothetical protein CEXT_86941 [Caerostris extrusa]